MAVRTAYDAVLGTVLTAANLDRYPGGWIGYAELTGDQGSITTVVDVTGLSVTVTVGTSRRLLLSAEANALSTVAGDVIQLQIANGSNSIYVLRNTISGGSVHCSAIITPSAGSNTFKVRALRSAGTGSCTIQGNPTYPVYILVQDIGPAS